MITNQYNTREWGREDSTRLVKKSPPNPFFLPIFIGVKVFLHDCHDHTGEKSHGGLTGRDNTAEKCKWDLVDFL